MQKEISYKRTIIACYLGFVIQATTVNITPLLFIPLREIYNISFEKLGLLTLINFISQVACDLIFAKAADRYGFRRFILITPILAAFGFLLFALSPFIFPDPYVGFVISTIIFASASGLLEVLLSPIVDSIPSDEKEGAMSLLHSFYAWGQMFVILVTTFLLYILGRHSWQIIMLFWIILPVIDFFLFLKAPLADPVSEDERMRAKDILFHPYFILCFIAITFGGGAELIITQWISAFLEAGIKIPKVMGDVFGMCFFAFMLGMGRLLYGIYSKKISLIKIMIVGSLVATVSYAIIALSPYVLVSLIACAFCGLGVSLLWPGNLVLASDKFPLSGAWIFAILAAGGDIGASVGPWLVGFCADRILALNTFTNNVSESIALRVGMSIGILFSVSCLICLIIMNKMNKKSRSNEN